jgi:hypothetical protein
MCEISCLKFFARHFGKEEALYYGCDLCREIEKYCLPEIVPFSLYLSQEISGSKNTTRDSTTSGALEQRPAMR